MLTPHVFSERLRGSTSYEQRRILAKETHFEGDAKNISHGHRLKTRILKES
jgi:hypothetical protein